ncbi:hypothetical protein PIIN_08704 [Serendipita indica DSM 11827]|uniref:Uncharacterized protein n=1 Tax=Serendipita indica (strain DSM 11827) TaxID=1109443 RepID=G4TTV3_SERID|nr:hypothetical protein PIIN_08704 [Serendipita indica DSM 11827]
MLDHNTACSKIPVEIWIEVFQYHLGPSLSNPRCSSVLDYQRSLFDKSTKILYRYRRKEQKRVILQLVSRFWKLAADQVGDRIVFVYPLGYQVPPNYPISDAKHIHIYPDYSIDFRFPSDYPEQSRLWEYNVLHANVPVKLGRDVPFAQIVHLGRYNIVLTDPAAKPDDPLPGAVRALYWSPPSHRKWCDKLAHKSLRSLVALHIESMWSSMEVVPLHLPILRYLYLRTRLFDGNKDGTTFLTRWNFPVLAQVYLVYGEFSTGNIGAFLHRHSMTIEELGLHGKRESVLACCLKGLPRLKTYVVEGFDEFIAVSSPLNDMWCERPTNRTPASEDYLIVQLLRLPDRLNAEELAESLPWQILQMKKQVRFQMHDSWTEMREDVLDWVNPEGHYNLVEIIRTISDHVFDGEGTSWYSAAARVFETAVLHQYYNYLSER